MTANPGPEVSEYRCPNCGGAVRFDARSAAIRCQACHAQFDPTQFDRAQFERVQGGGQSTPATLQTPTSDQPPVEVTDAATDSSASEMLGQAWAPGEIESLAQYSCPSCGGQIVTGASTSATHCVYCDNPTVLLTELTGLQRPDYVVPFTVTKDQVTEALGDHVKGKRLAPKQFRSQAHIDAVTGLYVPFWVFDCEVQADMSYTATQVTRWSDSSYDYTKTDVYAVRRAGRMSYTGVPVDAAKAIDNDYMESLEPYDYQRATDFEPTYLLGYLAQKYDETAQECQPRANRRVSVSTEQAFRDSVRGYATVAPQDRQVDIPLGSAAYFLMPVWLLNTKYRDQLYTFAMNGQTGAFVGQLPVSWGRFWAWFFGLWAGVGTIVGVLTYLILGAA